MTQAAIWTRSAWTDAAMLAEAVNPRKVSPDAAGKLPHEWYASLLETNRLFEAVEFVAHALPRYECAVWAAQALLELGVVDRLDPVMVGVLRWIDEPSDALRRACHELAEASRSDSPAIMLAQAVFLSGGSLAPEDLAPVLPPPDVCAKLAAGAVLSGAYACKVPDVALRTVLRLGEAMVAGR